jgi:uncharacterized protein (DUF736 family)
MSKIDCGSLTRIGKEGAELRGPVSLGNRLDGVLLLRRHPRAGSSEDHPDFAVEYAPRGSHARSVGAGWLKKGERAGDFITMTVDDPDWPSPLNLTAFRGNEGGEEVWTIVWSRPRVGRVDDASPPRGGRLDDASAPLGGRSNAASPPRANRLDETASS